ncbi:hypothetical protein CSA56_03945 [candidate division KSB3 bacterium]|uniref:non-specific serine/threonine protein kinase n=1 Tax=candidate division KSB3 bacterium TaxID=2044937 RepID=A0A2G6KIK8_9BACT|nr:MAG: hypothetical protein CSA56_03945 [candidate division KSB3 bacterium]
MKTRSYTLADAKASEQANDYAKAAEAYFELGDYPKAEAIYRTLEQRFPFHKNIKFSLGKLLATTQHWDEAITKLQEVGNSGAYGEETLYLLAECFKNKGLLHAAREIYADLLERNYHYKDAREKLRALDAPTFFERAVTQQTVIDSSLKQGSATENSSYQTMHGFAVEDRYTIIEELGRGGMGIVYKAEDTHQHRLVAVKVLSPHLAAERQNRLRFFREAEMVAGLRHPHIVTLLDIDQRDNFLVMEYLPGGTLSHWKHRHKGKARRLFGFILQILEALDAVHRQGIIHRDIKPQNILISDDTTAKLTDFGIAHICGATITHTGMHLGTIPYMSPEQILGTPLGSQSDIYTVGVVLYELVTGQLPFSGKDISYHHVHTPPPPPRNLDKTISSELNELILRCLAKMPDDRYESAKVLQQELFHILTKRRDTVA